MSDKAQLHLSGYVNEQKFCYWAPNSPHELHQCPLHSARVTVQCAVSFCGIIGPYFFENVEEHTGTVNAEQYTVLLETFLCNELHPCQQDLLFFQQDGATAHTVQISTQVLRTVFPSRLISHFGYITWRACSHDLAVPDYFSWGYVRNEVYKVYETRAANIYDLQQQILECVQGIHKALLRVITAFSLQLQERIEQDCGHLQSVIFKQ
jgi:hypothetical protein